MSIPSDIMSQVLSLPAHERYALAQQLLDSIDDKAAETFDAQFIADLRQRRDEMMRGEHIVSDWRAALSEIDRTLSN